jgi:hypothetical protein
MTGTQALLPVKGQVELELQDGGGIAGDQGTIRVKSANRGRGTTKVVAGRYSAGGSLPFAVTPDKGTSKLFYCALANLTPSALTQGQIPHVFKPANDGAGPILRPFTWQEKFGDTWIVNANQYVTRLVLRGATDGLLTGSVDCVGAGPNCLELAYDAEQSDAGIVASSLDPFVFWGSAVQLAGATTYETGNWEITHETGFALQYALGCGRAARRGTAGEAKTTGSFDMVFADDTEYKRWMGNARTARPYTPSNLLTPLTMQLKYVSGPHSLQVDLPAAYYTGPGGPKVEDKKNGAVTQRLTFETKWDLASAADIIITLINAELDAAITTVGTPIPA